MDEPHNNHVDQIYRRISAISEQKKQYKTTPKKRNSTNPESSKRRLDSLARLITGDNICSAIRYYNKTILIASNNGDHKLAKAVLDTIKDFSEDNKKDKDREILKRDLLRLYIESSWKPLINQLINKKGDISTLKQDSKKEVKDLYDKIWIYFPDVINLPPNNKKRKTII